MNKKKYIYGLDLSLSCTGVTIFDLATLSPVCIESIETNKKSTHGANLKIIADEFKRLKEQYPPELLVIERGFSRFNTSTQVIYRVHGVTNYIFHDVSQIYYPPKKIKEAIVKGDASKPLVRSTIENKYPEVQFKNEDESDSFAIALTYLILNGLIKWEKYTPTRKSKKKSTPKNKADETMIKKKKIKKMPSVKTVDSIKIVGKAKVKNGK